MNRRGFLVATIGAIAGSRLKAAMPKYPHAGGCLPPSPDPRIVLIRAQLEWMERRMKLYSGGQMAELERLATCRWQPTP